MYLNLIIISAQCLLLLPHTKALTSQCCEDGGVVQRASKDCWYEESNKSEPLWLSCDYIAVPINKPGLEYYVIDGGNLKFINDGIKVVIQPEMYCVGHTVPEYNQSDVALLCPDEEEVTGVDSETSSTLMLISAHFLVLTAIIYLLLPELRDLQGKIISCLCVSSAVGMVTLAVLKTVEFHVMPCTILGFSGYFFIMASFFWMNALSMQVFRSVRFQSLDGGSHEFLWYSLYAWGAPITMLICLLAAEFIPGTHMAPRIGINTCWFYGINEIWAYFYGPISVLIFANSILFVYTAVLICQSSITSLTSKPIKYKFGMGVRLFVLMGLSWVFELAGSIHGQYHIVWVIADVYNLLQGVLTFIVLVLCRRRALKALVRRGLFPCCSSNLRHRLTDQLDSEDELVVEDTAPQPRTENSAV